jgi:hypothetical protein
MLRLLRPHIGLSDSTHADEILHSTMQRTIVEVSKAFAHRFVTSSARHLFSSEVTPENLKKLISIYQEAAELSYELWTQRRTMRCFTLRDMAGWAFDPKSRKYDLHTIQYSEDDSYPHLSGGIITVVVHPLLETFGYAACKDQDYSVGSIQIPAQVWVKGPRAKE